MEEYNSYYIPYSILESRQVERFLEKKAAEGHMLLKIGFNYKGRFQVIAPAEYCFAVTTYGRSITKREEKTKEFADFKRPWEERGWEYVCSFCACAIFCYEVEAVRESETLRYEGGPERPDTDSSCYNHYETVIKAENRQLLLYALSWIPYILFYMSGFLINVYFAKANRRADQILPGAILVCTAILLCLFPILECKLRQRKACKLRKDTGVIPDFILFWKEEVMNVLFAGFGGILGIFIGYRALSSGTVIFSAAAAVLSVIMFLLCYLDYKKKRQKNTGEGKRMVKRLLSLLPFLFLIPAVLYYPFEKDYRFEDWKHSVDKIYDPMDYEQQVIIGEGLGPKELGWGEETGSFYTDNHNNMVCRSERAIYRRVEGDMQTDIRKVAYREQLRYIGTIQAELKKAEYLVPYLQQKKLSLDGSVPLAIEGEMKYYLTEGKKEIIGIDQQQIVIYFLNSYDERCFDAEDGRLLEAVEELEHSRNLDREKEK